jgi:hypothetical protein
MACYSLVPSSLFGDKLGTGMTLIQRVASQI